MRTRSGKRRRLWPVGAAVVVGAGVAFAYVVYDGALAVAGPGHTPNHAEAANAGSSVPQSTVTTTTPPAPSPILPFNAKIFSSDIPVKGGGVRSGGCSGSLIAPQWIITAGHCFRDVDDVRTSGPPTHVFTVTVGKLKDSDPGGHTANVVDVRQSPENDIALAKLATPVEGITPLTLADTPPTVGQQLAFVGWGSRSADVKLPSEQLKRGQFAVLAVKSIALEADSVVPRTVDNSPCPDDSGAPYFVSTDDRTGVLVAVESTGPPCPQAGRETISRVDVVADWIREQITQ